MISTALVKRSSRRLSSALIAAASVASTRLRGRGPSLLWSSCGPGRSCRAASMRTSLRMEGSSRSSRRRVRRVALCAGGGPRGLHEHAVHPPRDARGRKGLYVLRQAGRDAVAPSWQLQAVVTSKMTGHPSARSIGNARTSTTSCCSRSHARSVTSTFGRRRLSPCRSRAACRWARGTAPSDVHRLAVRAAATSSRSGAKGTPESAGRPRLPSRSGLRGSWMSVRIGRLVAPLTSARIEGRRRAPVRGMRRPRCGSPCRRRLEHMGTPPAGRSRARPRPARARGRGLRGRRGQR